MVSSQEFGCLLDMVYTGKLPIGKHNVSRIIAAADSLHMFDVAVGFKNVLTSLMIQQPSNPVPSAQTPSETAAHKSQSRDAECSLSAKEDGSTAVKMESVAELEEEDGRREAESEEPACKTARVDASESSGPSFHPL